MLFAISGSQGSGKSTVVGKLAEVGYPTVERKTSRSILTEWDVTLSQVNNDRELTVKFQEEILKRKEQDEAAAVADVSRIWFTERSYADLFAYALIALGKDNEYSEWLDSYFDRCKKLQTTYSHNFYLRSGQFKVETDGVRGVNKHYVKMVDIVMLNTLESFKFGTDGFDPITLGWVNTSSYTLINEREVPLRASAILQQVSGFTAWSKVEHDYHTALEQKQKSFV